MLRNSIQIVIKCGLSWIVHDVHDLFMSIVLEWQIDGDKAGSLKAFPDSYDNVLPYLVWHGYLAINPLTRVVRRLKYIDDVWSISQGLGMWRWKQSARRTKNVTWCLDLRNHITRQGFLFEIYTFEWALIKSPVHEQHSNSISRCSGSKSSTVQPTLLTQHNTHHTFQ